MEQKVGKGKYLSPMVGLVFHEQEDVICTSGGFGTSFGTLYEDGDVGSGDIFSQGGGGQ